MNKAHGMQTYINVWIRDDLFRPVEWKWNGFGVYIIAKEEKLEQKRREN